MKVRELEFYVILCVDLQLLAVMNVSSNNMENINTRIKDPCPPLGIPYLLQLSSSLCHQDTKSKINTFMQWRVDKAHVAGSRDAYVTKSIGHVVHVASRLLILINYLSMGAPFSFKPHQQKDLNPKISRLVDRS